MKKKLLALLLSGALLVLGVIPSAAESTGFTGSTTAEEMVDVQGLITEKTAVMQPDGSVRLRLETYVTGGSTITSTESDVPTDIILVLDQSGSMAEDMYQPVYELNTAKSYHVVDPNGKYRSVSWQQGVWASRDRVYQPKTSAEDTDTSHVQFYEKQALNRLDALKQAAQSFADSVAGRATDKANHRIAVAGFASDGDYNFSNTELFVGGRTYRYKNEAKRHYGEALQDMNTQTGKNNVAESINALSAGGGTHTDLGIDMAQGIFDAVKGEADGRNRVVVIFTDGQPGDYGFNEGVANNAIAAAKTMKSDGVTVFTVGIFTGADPADSTLSANKFMNYLSSNYPEARSMQSPGRAGEKGGYYLAASSAEGLRNVFQTISDSIQTGGASIELDDQAQVRDVISDYFVLPQEAEKQNITLRTAVFTGYAPDGETPLWGPETDADLTTQVQGRTLTVTGFDFSEHYVGMDREGSREVPHGSKLILELTVQPRAGFLGGNRVPTNADSSGVYDGAGTLVENYPRPTVDVPIPEVVVTPQDRNVYLLGSLSSARQTEGAQVTCGGVDLTGALEPWQTAFVTTRLQADTEKSGLLEDTTYQLRYTVTPIYDGTVPARSGFGTGNIAVFSPQVTLADQTVWYGGDAPDSCAAVATAWRHGSVDSGDMIMEGDAPALTLTAVPVQDADIQAGKIAVKTDIPMKVTAAIGSVDVTDRTELLHRACPDACGWTAGTDYLLHVKTCTLTIEKTSGRAGETYVFSVLRNDTAYTQVRITGSGSVTISELPVGEYTIAENAEWSWRWGEPTYSAAAELSAADPQGQLTCQNIDRDDHWLSGYSTAAVNEYRGGEAR